MARVLFSLSCLSLLWVLGGCDNGAINAAQPGEGEGWLPDFCADSLACCPEGKLHCSGNVDNEIVCVCDAGWDCVDGDCRADAPVPGGAASWDCGYDLEFGYSCTQPGTSNVPPPGGANWSCTFDDGEQLWRCVRDFPPNPSNTAEGAGAWSCETEGEMVHCESEGGGSTHNTGGEGGGTTTPGACVPTKSTDFQFLDTLDGDADGELAVLGNTSPHVACGIMMVAKTGYYNIYDKHLAESCTDQLDETGYLTITNSCNKEGAPVKTNAPGAFVVVDTDNTNSCGGDGDCDAGQTCSPWYNGKCCIPSEPVFMGRFVLVAGEANEICLHHWCPLWLQEKKAGKDIGFIFHGCKGANSVHLTLDAETLLCFDGEAEPFCDP